MPCTMFGVWIYIYIYIHIYIYIYIYTLPYLNNSHYSGPIQWARGNCALKRSVAARPRTSHVKRMDMHASSSYSASFCSTDENTNKGVTSHVWTSHATHTHHNHVTHTNKSRHTNPGTVTIAQYRFNKTKQHTHTLTGESRHSYAHT